ncbi:MAG: acetyltransferase [Firmicutes bacterium]|nr:acetyltransferase [Bacillota bacterium]
MKNYIDPRAILGRSCNVGFFSIVREGAVIGDGTTIGNNVTVYPGTVIGENCLVGDNCVIGKKPHPAVTSTVRPGFTLPPLRIGGGAVLGSGVVLYAGSILEEEVMVGDLASVREGCRVGKRVLIGRGAVLENNVSVGEETKIQTGAYLTAYTVIGARVFVAPMVCTANDNHMGRTEERFFKKRGPCIEDGARVGAGALLLPGVRVAADTFVAAGSLVTRDTRPGTVVLGRPARFVRPVPENEKC